MYWYCHFLGLLRNGFFDSNNVVTGFRFYGSTGCFFMFVIGTILLEYSVVRI